MINVDDLLKRYRIEDPYSDEGTPTMVVWYVVRKTPSGAWIAPRYRVTGFDASTGEGVPWETLTREQMRIEGARFVLDGDGKRYAHETEEWARYSYRRRKLSQIAHSARSHDRAKNFLHWLETGQSAANRIPTATEYPVARPF